MWEQTGVTTARCRRARAAQMVQVSVVRAHVAEGTPQGVVVRTILERTSQNGARNRDGALRADRERRP